MKKSFIPAVIIGILFSTTVNAARVTTDLNVRQQPNKDAKIITVLEENTEIKTSKSKESNWDKIKLEDGTIGYVCNLYLEKEGQKTKEENQEPKLQTLDRVIELDDFRYRGIVDWNGWNWTYYLMSMFPGSTSTPVENRWINNEGFVCDQDGYIILASVDLDPYTVVETPFGYMGKVYDTGCPHGILDVYTNW